MFRLSGGRDRLTWAAVEPRIAGRSGWRRTGAGEYHGPCPVDGSGTDTAWIGGGVDGGIRIGCRHCAPVGGLDGAAFLEHARALDLIGGPAFPGARPAAAARARIEPLAPLCPDPAVAADWNIAQPLTATDPGAVYLRRRCSWPASRFFPESVRWFPAGRVVIAPAMPPGAAGALVYGYRAAGESGPGAVQFEAVDGDGERVEFDRAGKRPSMAGCSFAEHRRVFWAAAGQPGAGVVVVEGPLDALAASLLERRARAVIGVAGCGQFTLEAVDGIAGVVVVAPDGDPPGLKAGVRLSRLLTRFGRTALYRPAPVGLDWCVYLELLTERAAMRDG